MKYLKLFEEYNNTTIDLYHGTCEWYAEMLLKDGFIPDRVEQGANGGNPCYLYLTSDKEDARWFANENGCNSILLVKNIPITELEIDPEDEDQGAEVGELIQSIKDVPDWPRKFIITKPLSADHFSVVE